MSEAARRPAAKVRVRKDPELFINRELSWLEFNGRVLEEAMDPTTPLLDRLKFAIIVSGNLDEFFMVRVAGLKHALAEGDSAPDLAGLRPRQQQTRRQRQPAGADCSDQQAEDGGHMDTELALHPLLGQQLAHVGCQHPPLSGVLKVHPGQEGNDLVQHADHQ